MGTLSENIYLIEVFDSSNKSLGTYTSTKNLPSNTKRVRYYLNDSFIKDEKHTKIEDDNNEDNSENDNEANPPIDKSKHSIDFSNAFVGLNLSSSKIDISNINYCEEFSFNNAFNGITVSSNTEFLVDGLDNISEKTFSYDGCFDNLVASGKTNYIPNKSNKILTHLFNEYCKAAIGNPNSISLKVGDTVSLNSLQLFDNLPEFLSNEPPSFYASSDTTYISITNGILRANNVTPKEGTVITAGFSNSLKFGIKVNVTTTNPVLTGFNLNKSSLTVKTSSNNIITLLLEPSTVSLNKDYNISFISDNTNLINPAEVSIDINSKPYIITFEAGNTSGECELLVCIENRINNNTFVKTCNITIVSEAEQPKISFSENVQCEGDVYKLQNGGTYTITSNKNVSWNYPNGFITPNFDMPKKLIFTCQSTGTFEIWGVDISNNTNLSDILEIEIVDNNPGGDTNPSETPSEEPGENGGESGEEEPDKGNVHDGGDLELDGISPQSFNSEVQEIITE